MRDTPLGIPGALYEAPPHPQWLNLERYRQALASVSRVETSQIILLSPVSPALLLELTP